MKEEEIIKYYEELVEVLIQKAEVIMVANFGYDFPAFKIPGGILWLSGHSHMSYKVDGGSAPTYSFDISNKLYVRLVKVLGDGNDLYKSEEWTNRSLTKILYSSYPDEVRISKINKII